VLSRANKVIVDEKSGSGNMLYLPLDKILERARSNNSNTDSSSTEPSVRVSPEPESVTVDGRSRGDR
jgi:hypothetical protein